MPEQATPNLAEYIDGIRHEIKRSGDTPEMAAGIIIGAASMCWDNMAGAGVFDSRRASALVDLLVERIGAS